MFEIKTVPSCPGQILRNYQSDEISGINITGKFVVKTREKEFTTSIYPFLQTDHLVDQLIGKANLYHRYWWKMFGMRLCWTNIVGYLLEMLVIDFCDLVTISHQHEVTH